MIMVASSRQLLESLFRTAAAAAHPSQCLPPNLPGPPPRGRLIVLAAGKAAGSMTQAAEQHYLGRVAEHRLAGIAVTRHGYGRPTRHIPIVEAGHPVPDKAGLKGTERGLALAQAAGADDLVLVLLSGGASANWIAPAKGITLAEKQAETRALLRGGAAIGDMNAVGRVFGAVSLAARGAAGRCATGGARTRRGSRLRMHRSGRPPARRGPR